MQTDLQFVAPCGPMTARADGLVVRATGIPYARATRFEAPAPVADWTMPFDATRAAPASPQRPTPEMDPVIGSQTGGLPQDENCQNLSITLPADRRAGELLPVMVWIHGGSYVSGAGDAPIYDPAALVAEQRVVVVSVTYRLGVLGYLGGRGRPANLGLLDQLAAFEWVQRNISAFGGDPNQVTAFGQSAGADAIAHLMATPNVRRLFRRAIMQSPPLGISRGRQKMADAMADIGENLLRDTPITEVLEAQERVAAAGAPFGLKGIMPFGTQYDSAPLPPEDQIATAWDAAAPDIEIFIGHTAHETRLFVPIVPATRKIAAFPVIGSAAAKLVSAALTRAVYSYAIKGFARRHRRAGGRAYLYTLVWAPRGNPFGAAHAIDIAMLFGTARTTADLQLLHGASWTQIDEAGRTVRGLWASFARGDQLPPKRAISGILAYTSASPRSPNTSPVTASPQAPGSAKSL